MYLLDCLCGLHCHYRQLLGCYSETQTTPLKPLSDKRLGQTQVFSSSSSNSGVVISQRKYTLDILTDTSMLDCKPMDTLIDPNVKLVQGHGELLRDLGRY